MDEIQQLEQQICDFFNIQRDELFSRNKSKTKILAKHFCVFILHKHYSLSTSYLANRYHNSRRWTFDICAQIKSYIKYDKKYQMYYEYLKRYIKKGE